MALAVSLAVVALFVALLWQFVLILVPYALSAFIAFLIMPLVNALASRLPGHRTRPRVVRAVTAGVATLVVLIIFAAVIAAGLFQLVQGTSALAERIPELVQELQLTMVMIEQTYRERVPVDIQAQIDPRLEAVGGAIIAVASDAAVQVFGILRSGLSLVIALAGAPIILFYLLYDAPAIGRGIRALLPGPLRNDVCNIGGLAGSTVIAYLRTQLLMAIMVGVVIGLAMWALGVPAAIALGVLAGLGELVPVVGPILAFAVAAIVTLVTNPALLPIVVLVYLAVQSLQNMLVVPRIQGQATGLHPLAVMLSLATLGSVWGFWGVLIAVPFVAAAYRVLSYARQEWNSAGAPGEIEADLSTGTPITTMDDDEILQLPGE
jgi:predicted PurR-regulated permease PerM